MKPATEMVEGPKALQNFEDTMKALFSAKKKGAAPAAPRNTKETASKQKRKAKAQ